ncbi:hypothetical protein [Ktedonospora formicarum]|nr:hypothetical protein [Ktedonospora formicarum]
MLYTPSIHARRKEALTIRYRMWIKGHLDPSWQEWFEDLQIAPHGPDTTALYGSLVDQAALYRVLLKIRSLGLVLLSLEADEFPSTQEEQ